MRYEEWRWSRSVAYHSQERQILPFASLDLMKLRSLKRQEYLLLMNVLKMAVQGTEVDSVE